MGAQVVFDFNSWLVRFPEFRGPVSEEAANALFSEATAIYHRNDGTGPVENPSAQTALLNLLVAHLAAKNYGENSDSGMVGQITSASQGSASISAQPIAASGTEAWYLTTRYGADYWWAMAPYRLMRYRVTPLRIFDPIERGLYGYRW